MPLEYKKLSAFTDLQGGEIDSTTKLITITGSVKANKNLPVGDFIEDSLTSESQFKPLSANQGKVLKDLVDTKANASDVSNIDNTSDMGKPVSTAQAAAIAEKANIDSPIFTGTVGIPDILCGPTGTIPFNKAQFASLASLIHPTIGIVGFATNEAALSALGEDAMYYLSTDNILRITVA